MSFLEDQADRWMPEPNTGCYLWVGGVNNQNRPRVGRGRLVSRLVCEEAYGGAPTSKHEAAHATLLGCVGGLCINPSHLRWATRRENQLDIPLEKRSEISRKRNANFTAKQRSEMARKRWENWTPEMRRERARKQMLSMTVEERQARSRKMSDARYGR